MLVLMFALLNPCFEASEMKLNDLYIFAIDDETPPDKPPKEDDLPPEGVVIV